MAGIECDYFHGNRNGEGGHIGGLITTRLLKIGNSQGIRIPKPSLEHAGLTGDLELEAQSGKLVVRPVSIGPRKLLRTRLAAQEGV